MLNARRALLLSALCLPLTACDGEVVNTVGPELALDACTEGAVEAGMGLMVGTGACAFDFGEQDITVRTARDLTIANIGDFDLTITDVYFTDDSDPSFELDIYPGEVPAYSQPVPMRITYRPLLASEHTATLVIVSDDGNEAGSELAITLTGTGVDNGVPDIDVSPAACDFGRAAQGSVKNCTLSIVNNGSRDLMFEGVELIIDETPGEEMGDVFGFFGRPPVEGDVISAEADANMAEVSVRFFPEALGSYGGTLVLRTNDPDEQQVVIPLRGIGVDPPTCNIGVASVNGFETQPGTAPTIEPLDDVILTADASSPSSASGSINGVKWEIVEQPGGSTAVLTNPTGITTGFTFADVLGVDLAGRYRIRATVTDDLGTDSVNECELEFEAIPTDSVLVQLSWDTSSGDMDLHFTKQNEEGAYCPQAVDPAPGALSSDCGADRRSDDCYFGNCKATSGERPDWDGDGVLSEGDPSLDIDDLDGFGPENINIDTAVEGKYLVGVDYYSGGGTVGNTVRVYLYGQLEAEFFRELMSGDFWEVAVVDWPAGCVEDLSTSVNECN
jgi:hypothetical protein